MPILSQHWKELLPKITAVILFVLSIAAFTPIAIHFGKAISPEHKLARNGQLVLSNADFFADSKVTLSGDWLFFAEALLAPQDISKQLPNATTMPGKGGWQLATDGNSQVIGYGTYFLTLDLPSDTPQLAIQLPKIETSYRLFLDENLVASAGVVGTSQHTTEPDYLPKLVLIPEDRKTVTLTLQVANFHSKWGGLWTPISVGLANDMFATQRDLVAMSMFILGVLAITAAYYLIQFLIRPSEKLPLVFATLCILLFFREFTNDHMVFILQFMNVGFLTTQKMNYLTFYLAVPALLYFLQLCFAQAFNKTITKICYWISAIYSLFVLLSPPAYMGHSLLSYQLFCILLIVYLMFCLCIAIKQKLPAAKMMLLSNVIVSAFALNDILFVMDLIETGRFFSLGIVGFIICQSYVINSRFNQILTRNETLSGELQQRNSQLLQLGSELEDKVERRTQELKQANQELQNLAQSDKLTGVLNRYGMQQHIHTAYERLRRNSEPCSIVICDFDNFKSINDSYGHDKGDDILVAGSAAISQQIREQDKFARWGEEFLVLLPNTDLTGAQAIAEKLRIAIEKEIMGRLAPGLTVTITAGVAQFTLNETFEMVFKRADNALYTGKKMGRNCVQISP